MCVVVPNWIGSLGGLTCVEVTTLTRLRTTPTTSAAQNNITKNKTKNWRGFTSCVAVDVTGFVRSDEGPGTLDCFESDPTLNILVGSLDLFGLGEGLGVGLILED